MKIPVSVMTPENYAVLLGDLRRIANASFESDLQEINAAIVEMKWEMGQRLCQEQVVSKEGRGSKVLLTQLAEDLKLEYTQLTRVVKFYKLFSKQCPTEDYQFTSWSHYKILISISDPKMRVFYLKETESRQWSMRELMRQVKQKRFEEAAKMEAQGIDINGELPVKELRKSNQALYLYGAEVLKVIDGDTLDVRCDLGFNVAVKVRLRLRGIDTAEINSDDLKQANRAAKAKHFVQEWLDQSKRVVFRSYKTDLHGRFVADVYHLPGEDKNRELIFKEGHFLNQQLVDANLARVV